MPRRASCNCVRVLKYGALAALPSPFPTHAMRLPSRLSARAWMLIPLCAFGFLVWTNYQRAQRVDYVTNTDRKDAVVDPYSSTGYAGGKRWLIVPEHNNRSYQWIAETQQMLARREWRVRHVDSENAPFGREVHSASVYRWWLGLIAWCDHLVSGRPLGLSVERAALWADPVLHLLSLLGTTLFVARCFGAFPAALFAVGMTTIYPFAGGFLPGVPDDHGLAVICALWSVLPLLAGLGVAPSPAILSKHGTAAIQAIDPSRRARRLFFIAGVAGGLGLWINVASQTPVLVGIALSGTVAAWIGSRSRTKNSPDTRDVAAPWQIWALGGAITCLAAYFIEYFPAQMGLRLEVNHPLYGLAWMGVGVVMHQIPFWFKAGKFSWSGRQAIVLLVAIAAVAALPTVVMLSKSPSIWTGDLLATRLSSLPNSAVAKNVSSWIARDGLTGAVGATCLPLLLLGPAAWLLARRKSDVLLRTRIALALGPVLVSAGLAYFQLRGWNLCDGMLLALIVAVTAAVPLQVRGWWAGLVGLVFLAGLFQLLPPTGNGKNIEFTRLEVEGLIERALAHWIADHADLSGANDMATSGGARGTIILAPPDRTTSWCFHGGLRGLGTANWENREGLAATIRIVTATTAAEALALLRQREVAYIILPSWDSDLDEFARWTLRNPEDAFIMAIHHWTLPPWLRPLPYKLPENVGFDGQSVVILRVTDEENRAAALSRLAEYFIESQQVEQAAALTPALERYPTDLGALVALAQIGKIRGDADGFARTFGNVLSSLAAGADRALPWDRRVSLSVVLAQGERPDLAREQVRRCLEKLDETRIRSLTTGSLYRLQVLCKALGSEIPDPKLRALALQLLPAELRSRL